jgi:hypothetical protein
VPSAVLALLLGAFFLSEDGKPLRAVYRDADLSCHHEWVDILKTGGDAGQLGKTLTMAANFTASPAMDCSPAPGRSPPSAPGSWSRSASARYGGGA